MTVRIAPAHAFLRTFCRCGSVLDYEISDVQPYHKMPATHGSSVAQIMGHGVDALAAHGIKCPACGNMVELSS